MSYGTLFNSDGAIPYAMPFFSTMEDAYGTVAQYYDVPSLSLRNAMYHTVVARQVRRWCVVPWGVM